MLPHSGSERREPAREPTQSSVPSSRPESDYSAAVDAACRFLSFRPRSEAEVRRRLMRRFPAELVNRVIEVLRNTNYLDDEEFARRWRLDRERFHPRGRQVLKRELSRFGVAREVIDRALVGMEEEENAYRAGLKVAVRLMSKDCTQEDLSRKLHPYLQRRGFAYSLARDTVNRLWLELAPQPLDGEINSGARS
ncbi:MAG: regulatory protein RecX [Dehalococcoidia bacterium]